MKNKGKNDMTVLHMSETTKKGNILKYYYNYN